MASVDITRTPSSNGNQKIWTWSGWIKNNGKSGDSTYQYLMEAYYGNNHRYSYVCLRHGTIECYDEDWKTLYPKSGDVVILNGTTLHRSSKNKSELPRSTYILHYTNGYYNPRYHRKRLK